MGQEDDHWKPLRILSFLGWQSWLPRDNIRGIVTVWPTSLTQVLLGKEFIFRIIIGKCLNTYFQVAFHWPLTLVHMELALSWLKDMPFRRGGWTLWVRLKEGGKYGHFCAYLRFYSLGTALEEFMLALNVAFLCLFCFLALADVHQHQRKNLSRTWCRGSYLNPDT